jgi:hypothetical protein
MFIGGGSGDTEEGGGAAGEPREEGAGNERHCRVR